MNVADELEFYGHISVKKESKNCIMNYKLKIQVILDHNALSVFSLHISRVRVRERKKETFLTIYDWQQQSPTLLHFFLTLL